MKRLTFLLGCLFALCASAAQSAAQERAPADASSAAPLKITTFALKAGDGRRGRAARDKGDWLSRPVVQVENVSGKPVKYLTVEISLPGAEPAGAGLPLILGYGQAPGQQPSSQSAGPLPAGAKVSLSVGGNACEETGARLLAGGVRPAGRVTAAINGVIFADGTGWFDGLAHVADPDNPLRWNVVGKSQARAGLSYRLPLLRLMNARYGAGAAAVRAPCWDRMGTQWVTCCDGFPVMASAVLVQVWGGIYEPFVMSNTCPDGYTTCEWVKAVGCSSDPWGEVPPAED